jgi:hypothetical protein
VAKASKSKRSLSEEDKPFSKEVGKGKLEAMKLTICNCIIQLGKLSDDIDSMLKSLGD